MNRDSGGSAPNATRRELPKRRPHRLPRRAGDAQPAFHVTEAALHALSVVRENQRARNRQALGIALDANGGLELVLDEPGENDRVYSSDGAVVLFVTLSARHELDGLVLDHAGTPGQTRFTLSPREAESDAAPERAAR